MVDSACDIARDEVVAAGAAFLPLHVRMGDYEYLDGVDLTHEEFYNRLTQGKEQPTTSQISPGFFEEAFRRSLAKDEEVVCLTVSSGLSGTCASALMARDELPPPILRTDILEAKDLKPGMELQGTVRNVIDFGVFVDIGVHQDGLVHISKLPQRVRHPSELLSVGDVVTVWVVEVDEKRGRISLTMVPPSKP